MGRPSRISSLINFIINRNLLNLKDKELRVKKEETFSNKELNIAASTIYKWVNEEDFLEIKDEYIVYKRHEQHMHNFDILVNKIYSNYDPQIGQQKQSFSNLFPEQSELRPFLHEMADDYEIVKLDNDEIQFTEVGIKITQDLWGRDVKGNLELCELCLKPLTKNEPIRILNEENYSEMGGKIHDITRHASCNARTSRKESSTKLICGYCNLPLSVVVYEKHLTSMHSSHFKTIEFTLLQMEPIQQQKLLSIALKNFMKKEFEEFKQGRENYKQTRIRIEESYRQAEKKGKLSVFDIRSLDPRINLFYLHDTTNMIIKRLFDDYQNGSIFDDINPAEIFQLIIAYQLVEYRSLVERKKLIKEEINKFYDFTGSFPYEGLAYKTHNPIEDIKITYQEKHSYSVFSDGDLLFHPYCFERYTTKQQEEVSKDGGKHS